MIAASLSLLLLLVACEEEPSSSPGRTWPEGCPHAQLEPASEARQGWYCDDNAWMVPGEWQLLGREVTPGVVDVLEVALPTEDEATRVWKERLFLLDEGSHRLTWTVDRVDGVTVGWDSTVEALDWKVREGRWLLELEADTWVCGQQPLPEWAPAEVLDHGWPTVLACHGGGGTHWFWADPDPMGSWVPKSTPGFPLAPRVPAGSSW